MLSPWVPGGPFSSPSVAPGDQCHRAWLSAVKLLRVVGLFCKQGELLRLMLCTQHAALSADGDGLGKKFLPFAAGSHSCLEGNTGEK